MKTFNHVDDVWEALEACETAIQIYDIIGNIPTESGIWWTEIAGKEELEVISRWWDEAQGDMVIESRIFEVEIEEDEE